MARVSLHIEHAISDLDTWRLAFSRFAEARTNGGVLSHRVRHAADDETYIYVDLEFGSAEQADTFKRFLEETVWASRDASPALAGKPSARLLIDVAVE
jgi:hypothetical protein